MSTPSIYKQVDEERERLRAALKIARHALTGEWAPMILNGEQATGMITPQYAIDVIDAALGDR
jgi:hypothetical protein